MDYKKRINKIREEIEKRKIEKLIIRNPSHIFYLTGLLEIEGIILIDKKDISLFIPEMYYQETLDNIGYNKKILNLYKYIRKNLKQKLSSSKVHFINTEFTISSLKSFENEFNCKLSPVDDFVLEIRMVKDEEEIQLISKAKEIAKKTLYKVKENLKEGMTEIDIVSEIHYYLRKLGARRESFSPIVASGMNTSYPHHKSKNKAIKMGEVMIIDLGADFCGYKSDLTETFFLGKVSKAMEKIYNIVMDVQKYCIDYIEENRNRKITGKYIHRKAIEIFKKYNLEKYFIHGLGHGVGIDVHEKPVLNSKSKDILKERVVFTIEPGLYIPGLGGVRIEDTIIFS